MATVTESVKEALVGVEESEELFSDQTRAEFLQNAVKDEESGEYYMGEHEFIDAIAPESEDYVSITFPPRAHVAIPATPATRNL